MRRHVSKFLGTLYFLPSLLTSYFSLILLEKCYICPFSDIFIVPICLNLPYFSSCFPSKNILCVKATPKVTSCLCVFLTQLIDSCFSWNEFLTLYIILDLLSILREKFIFKNFTCLVQTYISSLICLRLFGQS